jgi:light-regulated signal transduction histidine kinase (bacteriophytochrome)
MESILLNLLSNSIRYRAPDRIAQIHFRTEIINNEILLIATDNGLGIDLKKYRHKLFGLNNTFHRHPDSKGVGLFMTKTQIEAVGGSVTVESEVNKGTNFKETQIMIKKLPLIGIIDYNTVYQFILTSIINKNKLAESSISFSDREKAILHSISNG